MDFLDLPAVAMFANFDEAADNDGCIGGEALELALRLPRNRVEGFD